MQSTRTTTSDSVGQRLSFITYDIYQKPDGTTVKVPAGEEPNAHNIIEVISEATEFEITPHTSSTSTTTTTTTTNTSTGQSHTNIIARSISNSSNNKPKQPTETQISATISSTPIISKTGNVTTVRLPGVQSRSTDGVIGNIDFVGWGGTYNTTGTTSKSMEYGPWVKNADGSSTRTVAYITTIDSTLTLIKNSVITPGVIPPRVIPLPPVEPVNTINIVTTATTLPYDESDTDLSAWFTQTFRYEPITEISISGLPVEGIVPYSEAREYYNENPMVFMALNRGARYTDSFYTKDRANYSLKYGKLDLSCDLSNYVTEVKFNLFKTDSTTIVPETAYVKVPPSPENGTNTSGYTKGSGLLSATTECTVSWVGSEYLGIVGAGNIPELGVTVTHSNPYNDGYWNYTVPEGWVLNRPATPSFFEHPHHPSLEPHPFKPLWNLNGTNTEYTIVTLEDSPWNTTTITNQSLSVLYPYSVYLTSVEVVPDSLGRNGYESVSLISGGTKVPIYTVDVEGQPSSSVTGYSVKFRVSMKDAYCLNMALRFNFIDSNGSTFSYVNNEPLIELVAPSSISCFGDLHLRYPILLHPTDGYGGVSTFFHKKYAPALYAPYHGFFSNLL